MAQAKKFGLFSGVFTPSILTILGVIMYLRLPWIVGQAGLFSTIGIIVVAHIISVTTGLSVSSIATDKKVRAGGSYYIISRSLGLPIGGTLGLALFVGLSFSVSLYLIGFSESFLSYWDIEVTRNSIRIAGTTALLLVTIITFISTALALKTQYFILAAIALSLISIFFGNHNFEPAEPLLSSIPSAAPWMVLFGIFFPAVTGFEAGVSMSGDLKDPKKSIPLGTILAITVGLIVYIGLAVFFSYRVSSDALVNNSNILLDISFFPPLVIAGIWGATLSSAMGSILGAPRILQAASSDKITPKFFARGYGKENEPRNALLMTFLIAEAGILIGELDVIARVVSMFFITAYGFLNMSSALENWASPDFRPDFKVPKLISIVGSLACFLVMILLDVVAMFGATLVMGIIFLYLKRRELTLESGDTWEGVWSSIVRTGLSRLHLGQLHQRNWRPNIILFSGGLFARPHLVEFGKWLAYKRGVLSDFELVESRSQKKQPAAEPDVAPPTNGPLPGIFHRRREVDDIYEGMSHICRYYGMPGMEPNTVLLGWARNSRDPEKFAGLLHQLKTLDYNILLLDYDVERGFGDKRLVDIWWRGGNNNFTLMLYLIRFILSADEWASARLRLMVVNDDSSLTNTIYKSAHRIFEEYRIICEVKVIQNGIEQRPFDEILRVESREADLVLLGLPEMDLDRPGDFVKRFDHIISDLGTLLLVSASSYFETLYIGVEVQAERPAAAMQEALPAMELPALPLPGDERIAFTLETFKQSLETALAGHRQDYLARIEAATLRPVEALDQLIGRIFENLEKSPGEDKPKRRKLLARSHSDFLYQTRQVFGDWREKQLPAQRQLLEDGVEMLLGQLSELVAASPERLSIYYEKADFQSAAGDQAGRKLRKAFRRGWQRLTRRPFSREVPFRELQRQLLENGLWEDWRHGLESLGSASYQAITDLQKLLEAIREGLLRIEKQWTSGGADADGAATIAAEYRNARQRIADIRAAVQRYFLGYQQTLADSSRQRLAAVCEQLRRAEDEPFYPVKLPASKSAGAHRARIIETPEIWIHHQATFLDNVLLDLLLMSFQNRITIVVQRVSSEINLNLNNNLLGPMETVCQALADFQDHWDEEALLKLRKYGDFELSFEPDEIIRTFIEEFREAIDSLPETIETFSEEAINQIETQPLEDAPVLVISLRRLIEYMIEADFITPLQAYLDDLPQAFQRADDVTDDVVRLILFNLENLDTPADPGAREEARRDAEALVRNGEKRILEAFRQVNEIYEALNALIQRQLARAYDKMNTYNISRSAENLHQYILSQESQKVLSFFGIAREQVESFARDRLVRLLYQRSEEILAVRHLEAAGGRRENPVTAALAFREAVSPRPEVLNALPFYYKQLFLGEPHINRDFWVTREREQQLAERAMRHFQSGLAGGILVVGAPRSGKSAFCHYLAGKYFQSGQIFTVHPPAGGSADPEVFRQYLEKALQTRGDYPRIFENLPARCAIIIDDLELWWERSRDGFAVVAQLLALIEQYGAQCCFLVNLNAAGFQLINKIRKIDDHFLGVIECQPFDAEALKEVLMRRHRSTGLKFSLEGHGEDQLSQWRLARLFNRFFDHAQGNVGLALQAWIAQIARIQNNVLEITPPRRPEMPPWQALDPEWLVLLVQLLLHKQLTSGRLLRIMSEPEDTLLPRLNSLKRSGLISENGEGVLQVDGFIAPHLMQRLLELEVF